MTVNSARTHRYYILSLFVIFLSFFVVPSRVQALTVTPIRFELEGDPGQTVTRDVLIKNEEEARTYYISYANFEATGESGTPTFVEPRDGIGTWITTDSSIYVPQEGETLIPFSITIPENASPGGYFGTIFFGTTPPELEEGKVSVGSKIGVLVLLTVRGDAEEDGGIIEFDTKDSKNFFTSLPVSLFYRFQNTGADRIKPTGEITIRNVFGFVSERIPANQVEGNILPTQIRRFETTWMSGKKNASTEIQDVKGFFEKARYEWQNFAIGFYTAKIELSFGLSEQTSEEKVSFWILPWHFLIVFFIGVWIAFVTLRFLLRKYNARIIRKANLHRS